MFFPHPRVKVSIAGSLRDREVACSASDRQGSNFESCAWRTVSSQSSNHPQEVLLAQFSLYVHKGGLKPDSFYFIFICVHGGPAMCAYRSYMYHYMDYINYFRPIHQIHGYMIADVQKISYKPDAGPTESMVFKHYNATEVSDIICIDLSCQYDSEKK